MATVTVRDLPVIDTEVLVVGAGPSGLMAGLVLARRRIPAVVIDSKSGPTRESRAVAVQARSMEIYDQLGIVQEILDGGNPAARMQIGQDAGLLGFSLESTQSGSTDFPGIQIFEQSRNEELLSSALDEAGASVRWQCRLVAVINNGGADDGSVEALAESPDGLFRIRSRWCIGADGAGSTIRQEIGASFEGVTNGATFYVADLYGVSGLPENTLATRFGDTSFAVLLPLGPDGHGRIISMVPGESIDQETALARAQSDLGISHTHVDWFSSYRVHHRVASRFRRGAMFLVGDAGHVHSPVGGQGMNTGLQDSHNLANLLADVAHEHVDQQSLDRYEKERRPVAIKLVKVTDRAFGVIARRGRGIALMRRGIGAVMARLAPKILRGALGARAGGYWDNTEYVITSSPPKRRAQAGLTIRWSVCDCHGRTAISNRCVHSPGSCIVMAAAQFLARTSPAGSTAHISSALIFIDGCIPIGSTSFVRTVTLLRPYRSRRGQLTKRCCGRRYALTE